MRSCDKLLRKPQDAEALGRQPALNCSSPRNGRERPSAAGLPSLAPISWLLL